MQTESDQNDQRTADKSVATVGDALEEILCEIVEQADNEQARTHAKVGLRLLWETEGSQ